LLFGSPPAGARRGRLWGCAPFSAPLASPPKHPAGVFQLPAFHEGCAAFAAGASSLRSAISLRAAQCQRAPSRWMKGRRASEWLYGVSEMTVSVGERFVMGGGAGWRLHREKCRVCPLRGGLCALRARGLFLFWCFGHLRGGRQGGAGYGAAPPSRPPLHPPRSTPLSYPDRQIFFFGGGYVRTSPTCRLRFFMTPPPAFARTLTEKQHRF
jgi:hypothetical protein